MAVLLLRWTNRTFITQPQKPKSFSVALNPDLGFGCLGTAWIRSGG